MALASIALGISAGSSILGGLFGKRKADEAAEAQRAAAAIRLKAAKKNRDLLYSRADVAEENAAEAVWRGDYSALRLRYQNQVNSALSGVEHTETLRAADIVEQSSQQAQSFADDKAAEFRREAGEVAELSAEQRRRTFRSNLQMLGRERVATAAAGFVESGSELDRAVENANRLGLQLHDSARTSAREARRLRFAGDLAEYEGEVAGFEGEEQSRRIRLGADVSRFMSEVDEWSTEQSALVTLYDAQTQRKNFLTEADDLRKQGDLAVQYAKAGHQGSMAQARATQTAGTMGLLSSLSEALNTSVAWEDRHGTFGMG